MESFNCLVVEDEPLAAEILQDYIAEVPFLHFVGHCRDGIFALQFLQKEKVDVMFLDIHLPKIKGLDFLKTLKNPPQVIITTAYRDYALDSYELSVVDYLLKPISFNRFLMAVNKLKTQGTTNSIIQEPPHLLINNNKKRKKILLQDILYIESQREYVQIVTQQQRYLTKITLSEIELQIANGNFLRIHRSFIVALDKVTAYTAVTFEILEYQLPIGRSYRDQVQARIATKK
ncbi:MAG: DNA-binding response regulator [Pseudopedobacter saltans]|uniref:DNA-binding response regulator n=1 Tax=Pseudopedobacter saltans TaxID=151895 RepID=A0A2W5FBL4_9SPHI|nr:MAG: DNA-binding response regulator [Pseudopedobacter saltans]